MYIYSDEMKLSLLNDLSNDFYCYIIDSYYDSRCRQNFTFWDCFNVECFL